VTDLAALRISGRGFTLRDMRTVPESPVAFGDTTAAATGHALLDAPSRDLRWVGQVACLASAVLVVGVVALVWSLL
jgi:hypothetical protein